MMLIRFFIFPPKKIISRKQPVAQNIAGSEPHPPSHLVWQRLLHLQHAPSALSPLTRHHPEQTTHNPLSAAEKHCHSRPISAFKE